MENKIRGMYATSNIITLFLRNFFFMPDKYLPENDSQIEREKTNGKMCALSNVEDSCALHPRFCQSRLQNPNSFY